MKHVVTIHSERRAADRRPLVLGTTIDDEGARPAVVLVDDISTVGFRMVAAVPMIVGETVTIDLPRVGERSATLVRQSGVRFGCAFDTPITAEELGQIVEAGTERHALRQERAASGWRPGAAALAA